MAIDNDTRGWIMTILSGIACFLGASIICVDLIVRRFPGHQDFRIENSNGFLSSSLSLSFGVMLFSSLYKMLPSARHSLERGGFSEETSSWILIGLFLGGAVGIQLASRIMYHFMPSHVVDCDHTHDEDDIGSEMRDRPEDEESQPVKPSISAHGSRPNSKPLINGNRSALKRSFSTSDESNRSVSWNAWPFNGKSACDSGYCYGYTNPCGNCFRNVHARVESQRPSISTRSLTDIPNGKSTETTPLLYTISEEPSSSTLPNTSNGTQKDTESRPHSHSDHNHEANHHHHVPTNKFLSIGLQTSIAIALHKLPEGFITYATNHANPRLGVAVFLSLFIHNISEGFALALPLYLALHSRPKSMIWSALLGGVSQPLGAGIAALWFRIAGSTNMAPGEAVYGGMFAVVAGIMTSVALQLMGESLDLSHDKNLCFIFAFLGMGILGASSALTATS